MTGARFVGARPGATDRVEENASTLGATFAAVPAEPVSGLTFGAIRGLAPDAEWDSGLVAAGPDRVIVEEDADAGRVFDAVKTVLSLPLALLTDEEAVVESPTAWIVESAVAGEVETVAVEFEPVRGTVVDVKVEAGERNTAEFEGTAPGWIDVSTFTLESTEIVFAT